MSEDSEETSDHTPLVRMGSDDDLSNLTLESTSEGLSVSNRELASDPSY